MKHLRPSNASLALSRSTSTSPSSSTVVPPAAFSDSVGRCGFNNKVALRDGKPNTFNSTACNVVSMVSYARRHGYPGLGTFTPRHNLATNLPLAVRIGGRVNTDTLHWHATTSGNASLFPCCATAVSCMDTSYWYK